MKRVIKLIISPEYGAGWSTWGKSEMALDQELAEAIEEGKPYDELSQIAEKNWPGEYQGGLKDCEVHYLEEGTLFCIVEYDGSETLLLSPRDMQIAKLGEEV